MEPRRLGDVRASNSGAQQMQDLSDLLRGLSDTLRYPPTVDGVANDILCFVHLIARAVFETSPTDDETTAVVNAFHGATNALGPDITPVLGDILAVYLRTRNYLQIQTTVERLGDTLAGMLEAPETVAASYYYGVYLVLSTTYRNAAYHLDRAYAVAPARFRPLLMLYLVPLHLRQGSYPPRDALATPGLAFLAELCTAVHAGNVGGFEQHVAQHSAVYARHGCLDLVHSLRLIVFRNLLAVLIAHAGPKLRFAQITAAVAATGVEMDDTAVQSVLVNMASAGILAGQVWVKFRALSARPTGALGFYRDCGDSGR